VESVTKNRQPERTLRAMAERAYGPAQVPAPGADWVSELGHGWFNLAYRLRLRDGARVVLKRAALPPPSFPRSATRRRSCAATGTAS
jgi:hypothetical protein